MIEFIKTLLTACIPAVITGIISFCVAKSQANGEIKKLKMENAHDLERLMEQHKVDIEHIREQHKLELESKEKDHQHKLEIMQKEHENELIRQEKEQENTAKYAAMGNVMTGLFNGIMGGALSSPEVQSEVSKKILEGIQGVEDTQKQQHDTDGWCNE